MPKKYPSEQRDRATRMVLDRLKEYPSVWAAAQAGPTGPQQQLQDHCRSKLKSRYPNQNQHMEASEEPALTFAIKRAYRRLHLNTARHAGARDKALREEKQHNNRQAHNTNGSC